MQKLTRHHIIGQNAIIGDTKVRGVNDIRNIVKLKETPHRGLHMLFGIENHPISQYSELFERTSKVLIDDIEEEIRKILELAENLGLEAYKKDLFMIK